MRPGPPTLFSQQIYLHISFKDGKSDCFLFFLLRFYGQSEDGDEFSNSIRQLFLAFNTLMDRPLEEAVKIKVSWGNSSCHLCSWDNIELAMIGD